MTPKAHEHSDFAPTERLGLEALPHAPAPGRNRPAVVAPSVRAKPVAEPLAVPPRALAAAPPVAVLPSARAISAAQPAAAAPQELALRLFVRGFTEMEQRLLEGTVRLSQRRLPRLELVREDEAMASDLVMIDGSDNMAVAWAESQRWLTDKTTIWVDSRVARPGHTLLQRPVQWSILPMLLARALELASSAATKTPEAARRSDTKPAPLPAGAAQVLVVDDSLAVRNHLRSLLEARGLQVSEANCVKAALEAVTAKRYACVLMDVLMPDLDGYEGCKRIKSLKSSIGFLQVVMLTSKSSPFDRIRGKMAGCDAYLTKPVEPARLYEVLAKHIGVGEPSEDPADARAQRTGIAPALRSAAPQRA